MSAITTMARTDCDFIVDFTSLNDSMTSLMATSLLRTSWKASQSKVGAETSLTASHTRVSWPVIDVGSFSRKYITKNMYFHICNATRSIARS